MIDLVSSRGGTSIRTLGKVLGVPADNDGWEPPAWDASGDLDGDHYPDLIIGDPSANDHVGRVVLVSGKTGTPIMELSGKRPHERFGTSLAFLGDLDGDGHDDFAVGAGQYDPDRRSPRRDIDSHESTFEGGEERRFVIFADGTRMTEQQCAEEYLRARSDLSGIVSVRSGRDRSELWRAAGKKPGHAFGSHLRAVGDLDQDDKIDLLVQSDLRASDPLVLLSGARGKSLGRLTGKGGPAGQGPRPIPHADRPSIRIRRSSEDLEKIGARVLAQVKSKPGQRLEEIGRALKTDTGILKRPIARLLGTKKLKTKGRKRGTKYFTR